jgi:predicted ATP-dependent endonuclease of OLD family
VYTTHSFGCLPEDLGLGVRFIQPEEDQTSSRVINKFWGQEEDVGLSPILFGMGATTMAFLPVRYCVLVEGPTDILLLPALLRAATQKDSLGYQVSPGLAKCNDHQISLIQNDGSRVLFLLDGDDAGKEIETTLKKVNVPPNRIFRLDAFAAEQCVIEDFVDKALYVSAVNEELRRSGRGVSIDVAEIPNALRPSFIEQWCAKAGIPVPHKVEIAYHVLERIHDDVLIEESKIEPLRRLHLAIEREFRRVV